MGVQAKSETQKWMEGAYAQLRLDGHTHEQAMAKINKALDEAIPQVVADIMEEIRGPPEPQGTRRTEEGRRTMSNADEIDYDEPDDVTCWQCGGEGGWNSCMEDTCCAPGGEEWCTDSSCWRVCDICRGEGGWSREALAQSHRPTEEKQT